MHKRWRQVLAIVLVCGLAMLPFAHAMAMPGAHATHTDNIADGAHSADCHSEVSDPDADATPTLPAKKADAPCKFCGLSHCFSVALGSLPELPIGSKPAFVVARIEVLAALPLSALTEPPRI